MNGGVYILITYKNNGKTPKKFYNIEFLPGDVKSVKGYINDPDMVRVTVQPVKRVLKSNKSEKQESTEVK